MKEFLENVDFEKISRQQKSMKNYPVGKEITIMKLLPNSSYFKI